MLFDENEDSDYRVIHHKYIKENGMTVGIYVINKFEVIIFRYEISFNFPINFLHNYPNKL
jgi:hypothetical protein